METRNEAPATMAVSPGNILREELRERRISQKELAERIGIQPSHLSEIIRGKRDISRRVADKLEHELGIPSIDWMRMQLAYDYDMVGVPRERGIIESVHPGKVLKAEMKRRDVSPDQLSAEIGVPLFLLNDLLEEKTKLETEMAMMLEAAIGLKASWLLSLQNEYDMLMAGRNAPFMEKLKKIRQIAAALSLVVFLFVSCTSRQTASVLNDVETYIQERPDSALAVLRAIDTTTLSSRSLRAHYALLHAMALDKNWIDTTDVNVVMPAVEYYDKHPSGIRRAKAWYYLGRVQENGADFTSSNISFLKSEKWASGEGDDYFKSLIYQSLSNTYSETHLYEDALKYSILSFDASSKIGDTLGVNASRYRIAQDLNNLNRYHEADSLFRILIDEEISISPYLFPAILSDYAFLRLQQYGDYQSAVSLFEESINRSGYLRTHNLWGAYAYALLRSGKQGKAEAILRQLETTDTENALAYKNWRSRADAFSGKYESAYERIILASQIQQKNVEDMLKQSTLRAQMDYHKQENDYERQRVVRRNLLFSAFSFLLLSAAAGIIAYLRKRNLRITYEREALLESYKALSTDFDTRSREQAIIRAKYIDMYKTHFGQIGQIHYLLRHSAKDRDTYLYRELKKAIGSIRTDEESQQQFEKNLNNSLNNVMTHFREAFPGRKPQYYQLASYLFAGFNATIISNIIQELTKDNVYVRKWRMKKDILESNCEYKELFLNPMS